MAQKRLVCNTLDIYPVDYFCGMLLESIAAKILVDTYKYKTTEQAVNGLKSEFKKHFPTYSYNDWNKDIPDSLAQIVIANIGKNGPVSERFIIKDLEIISKQL